MFTASSSELLALQTELNTDPDGLGYAPSTDGRRDRAIVQLLMGASGNYPIFRPVPNVEVVSAVLSSDFTGLTAGQQRAFLALVTPDTVDATSVNVRGTFQSLFSGTASIGNLNAIATRDGNRLEDLFGTGSRIQPVHVQAARLIT